jgi:hypothetical protein
VKRRKARAELASEQTIDRFAVECNRCKSIDWKFNLPSVHARSLSDCLFDTLPRLRKRRGGGSDCGGHCVTYRRNKTDRVDSCCQISVKQTKQVRIASTESNRTEMVGLGGKRKQQSTSGRSHAPS